ncbi:hypothetical protein [Polaribacter porphyrae]|uniref:Uncharacterized protein n=1 Tax=Polaribacter porphyrae TaxID=1137780 RepID=A0A2S7WQG8_9FLAO|nr:hypothetical protein [Polaribacter porphyrae]PQJ79865.1 hypothetical protein BTO18_12075 [Polaribacter porphyrae]
MLFTLIIAILSLSSCSKQTKSIDEILNSDFEIKQISRGNNNPKISLAKDSIHIFLTALHYKIPVQKIASKLNWNDKLTKENIDALTKNGLIKNDDGILIPKLGILTLERGKLLNEKCKAISQEIANGIESQLLEIKKLHNKTTASKSYSFQDLSLFYISNVLLDNVQIANVERDFLKEQRPLRNGSRYYLSIQEKEKNSKFESFGIYGNQILVSNDSIVVAAYGNTRNDLNVGWKDYKNKLVHSFSKNDFNIIVNEMPKLFLTDLIKILNKHKRYFEEVYKELNFNEEVSFEEFFIWWYHIIYTQTTDILIELNIIEKPASDNGLIYYELILK